jgi:isoleucyl-tRNA synthetase
MAPIAPFFSDRLFVDLNAVTNRKQVDSVHLTDFPSADAGMIDKPLEERMELAQMISSMVLSIRKKMNIRVRQPLNRILIPQVSAHMMEQVELVKNLILSEVNVKDLEYITDTAGILVKRVKPDFKKLGPRYGKLMKPLAEYISAMTQHEILTLEREGHVGFTLDGQEILINADEAEIISEDIPGWQVANSGSLTVALDITLTPELVMEGIAREVINRIQNLRKDNGFEVTDKITVEIEGNGEINEAVEKNIAYICSETLAQDFLLVDRIEAEDKVSIELTDTISTHILIRKVE